jgi:hypothetical protein
VITENDVIEAVCRHLEQNSYQIIKRCSTAQKGEDIVAEHVSSGITIRIEAKGETSDLPSSKRFGKPFSRSQCQVHVANAFYTAAAMLEAHASPNERVGVAFPDSSLHRKYLGRVKTVLQKLGIAVFWVEIDDVNVESPWPL